MGLGGVDLSCKAINAGLIQLMRPRQWIKNGFVLAPLIFSGRFVHLDLVCMAVFTAFLFCLASAATYIVNDYYDIDEDQRHPKKSLRPLASGQITKAQALSLLIALYGFFLVTAYFMPKIMGIIGAYLLLNLAYTLFLKHLPIIDMVCIAIGFVLRVLAGAVAISVPLSPLMCVTTFSLALYLGAIKRRQEFVQNGYECRKSMTFYTVAFITRLALIAAIAALFFYGLFVLTTALNLLITMPLVIYGVFRYWYLVLTLDYGESPTDLLIADWQLLMVISLWMLTCVWLLWPQ